MANQLKIDPTRTTMLRKKFVADMTRRFRQLSRDIQELVVDDDAFGLAPGDSFLFLKSQLDVSTLVNQQVAKQAWRFRTNSQKVKEYRNWLKQRVKLGILKPVGGLPGQPWTATYIESAYKKGAIRAYTDLRVDELAAHPSLFEGGQAEFMRTAFGSPEVLQKIELLYERAFNELDGITKVMEQQMSRTLAEGLSQGWGIKKIAKSLTDNVSKMNRTRANVLARTEIIRAHAEGQLDSFERLGVEELQLMAEWSTAGDERVCIECGELEGVVMTVEEARGLIPRHPNCRCMWMPANKTRREKGQIWSVPGKKAAIKESIKAEHPKLSFTKARKRSVWPGKEKSLAGGKIAKKTAAQEWAEEFTRKARGEPTMVHVPYKVGDAKVKAASEKLFAREGNYTNIYKKGTKEIKYIQDSVKKAYKAAGIKPTAGAGYCDQVSVSLWDIMGRPKNMKPYSVFYGAEEHVILYSKKTGLIIDATGQQFGNKIITLKGKSGYKKFYQLVTREIEDARSLLNPLPFEKPIIKKVVKLKKLSEKQKLDLWRYTRQGYDETLIMRQIQHGRKTIKYSGGGTLDAYDRRMYSSIIKGVTGAIERLPSYEGVLYRGLGIEKAGLKKFLAEYKVGSTVKLKNFVSSSKSKGMANRFGKRMRKGENKTPYLLQINAKSGKGITTGGGHASTVSESEYLFAKGTRFKVTGRKGNIIYMDEI